MKKFFIFLCFALFCGVLCGSSVYAADVSDYSSIHDASDRKQRLIVYKDTAGDVRAIRFTYLQATDTSQEIVKATFYDNNLSVTSLYSDVRYNLYKSSNGGESFTQENSSQLVLNANQSILVNSATVEIIASSFPIYDSDGNVVFPEASPPTLEMVVKAETMVLQAKTVETMKILTVCGIGLLALLVSLVILPKVLYRFL